MEDQITGSDAVAVRTTQTGTHLGSFFGIPPTGRRVRVSQMNFERFHGNQIHAHHRITDELSLMRQLGIIP